MNALDIVRQLMCFSDKLNVSTIDIGKMLTIKKNNK